MSDAYNDVRMAYRWCGVCLVSNLRMCIIENEELLDIYEKLTNTQPNNYGIPEAICYICYALLQRACRLSRIAQKSQNVMKELYRQGVEVHKMEVMPNFGISFNLSMSNISTTYVPNYSSNENLEREPCVIKEEPMSDVDADQTDTEETLSELEDNNFFNISAFIEPYVCDVCDKVFNYKHYWQSHIKTHTGDRPYNCNVCNEGFTSKNNLQCHQAIHTEDWKRFHDSYICKDKIEWHETVLITNVRTIREPMYFCNICNKAFRNKRNLQYHMSLRTEDKTYVCSKCNMALINKINLQYHKCIQEKR